MLPLRHDDGTTTLLVTDSARHRLVELAADGGTVLRTVGSGERGLVDGGPAEAGFAEPQGLALLPADVAARVGYDVVVADTADHALRGLRLADGHVVTVAGTGEQLRQRAGGGPALGQPLSTPWDVAWFDGQVVVAMAGLHQLWAFDPAPDPADGVVRLLAGTSAEGIRDGAGEQAWFAQPSGLAVSADGRRLWVADSETSALRWLERSDAADHAGADGGRAAGAGPLDARRHRHPPGQRGARRTRGLRGRHVGRGGAVRLRPRRRPRRRRPAPAPARRRRARGRLGRARRHLQRGGPPVRPRHRRGLHPGA